MTGYQSKRAAAQDKLAQPEQEALKLALEALKEIARHATTPWEDEWCGELANETLKAINALAQPAQEPVCPACKAGVLYECVACSSNNYPQKPKQEPVAWLEPEWGEKICPEVGYEVTMTDDHPKDLGWIPLVAQPAQEPQTCKGRKCQASNENGFDHSPECIADTARDQGWSTDSPQRPWVGLTDEEFEQLLIDAKFTRSDLLMIGACVEDICNMVEAKLKERNA